MAQSPVFELKRPNDFIELVVESESTYVKPEGVATLDVNADGLPDLLHAPSLFDHEPEQPLEIFLNMGDGRFVESANSVIDNVPTIGFINHPTIIADFNGDGADDAFLVDQGLEIGQPDTSAFPFAQPKLLLSNGMGGLNNVTSTHLPPIIEFNHNASVGDVDNDGDLDIAVAALSEIFAYLLVNDGSGRFELKTDIFPDTVRSDEFSPGSVSLADVNGDCRLDAIFGTYIRHAPPPEKFVAITLQTRSGQFVESQRIPLREDLNGGAIDQFVSEDFDGDGDVDIIAKVDEGDDNTDLGIMALRNDGGIFVDVTEEWLGASHFDDLLPNRNIAGLEVHDFNGDGAPDLSFAGNITIAQLGQFLLLNDGMGHFSPMPNADIAEQLGIHPFYADYDADGDLDIVGYEAEVTEVAPDVYEQGGYEIVVLENTSSSMSKIIDTSSCVPETVNIVPWLQLLLDE